jgi:flagellar basal-body rod modification protein FlgD
MIAPSIFSAFAPQSAASAAATSTGTNPPASNVLGPDSFITLLTAQLQAQDPLNPLDPNQMVDELTNMNTLQQTIQMRQDLDALLAAQNTGSPTPAASAAAASTPTAAATKTAVSPLTTAVTAITSNLAAISGSPAAVAAARQYSKAILQSKFF